MSRLPLWAAVAAMLVTGAATADTPPGTANLTLPPGFQYPNGIARAPDGDLYVGLVTSGRVLRRDADGAWSLFFPGSDEIYAGTSLRLDQARGLLWGTSPDFLPGDRARAHRVFALDADTGAVRRTLTLPDGGFGNDIAVADDGTIYVTDSRKARVLRLPLGSDAFEVLVEDARLAPAGGVGAAGIALGPDGRLVIGNYGTGRLYVLEAGGLRELGLHRPIENPDGIAFAPDGALLVLEGAVASGDGKVIRVPDPLAPGPRPLEVLRDGLVSPVNLTVAPDGRAWVSEARIRHRLIPGQEGAVPTEFRIVEIETGAKPQGRS